MKKGRCLLARVSSIAEVHVTRKELVLKSSMTKIEESQIKDDEKKKQDELKYKAKAAAFLTLAGKLTFLCFYCDR